MKKSEKELKVIIGIIYAVVAAAWLIWVLRTTSNFAGVSLVMYFIPLLIMLGIAGVGINHLMKDKDKVLDAVIFLVFQVLILVIGLITNANTQIVAGGILAVILAAIKKKVSK